MPGMPPQTTGAVWYYGPAEMALRHALNQLRLAHEATTPDVAEACVRASIVFSYSAVEQVVWRAVLGELEAQKGDAAKLQSIMGLPDPADPQFEKRVSELGDPLFQGHVLWIADQLRKAQELGGRAFIFSKLDEIMISAVQVFGFEPPRPDELRARLQKEKWWSAFKYLQAQRNAVVHYRSVEASYSDRGTPIIAFTKADRTGQAVEVAQITATPGSALKAIRRATKVIVGFWAYTESSTWRPSNQPLHGAIAYDLQREACIPGLLEEHPGKRIGFGQTATTGGAPS